MQNLLLSPLPCPSVSSSCSPSCPGAPLRSAAWPLWPMNGQALATSLCQHDRHRVSGGVSTPWLAPQRHPLRLGEGAAGQVTRICRHRHCAGCIQNSRANALAAGGRLLLSPNSSTQSIINTSPKAQYRHYGGSASHSGHHLLSRLQKLGK